MIYHLIVLLASALAIFWGFRRGMVRMVPSAIGIAFGVICARIFAPPLEDVLKDTFPGAVDTIYENFYYDSISTFIIFFIAYFLFKLPFMFLGRLLFGGDWTILNNIAGAIFSLFKVLFGISMVFNLLVATNHKSPLLKTVKSDDGNVVQGVMLISPSILGGEDVIELSHKIQLEEAKKIS